MKKLFVLSAVLIGAASASQAGVQVNLGFGIPLGPPVERVVVSRPVPVVVAAPACAQPAPTYYQPGANYYQSAPQCEAPAPVYVSPAPVYRPAPVVVTAPPVVFRPPLLSFLFGGGHSKHNDHGHDRYDRGQSGHYDGHRGRW